MARKNPARLEFDALSIEGGLFPAEWLAKVAATEASAQTPADYGIPKGLALRDEIGRYWRIAQALWRDFDLARGTTAGAEGVLASRAFLRQFLRDVLGFTDLTDGSVHDLDGRRFTPGFEGFGGRVPVFVGAPVEGLDDSVSRHGDDHRRRSAFGALQEYLNATETALWGLAGNGTTLRLVRDNASLTRPAWVEADLGRMFAEERYADFAAFWLLAHASRFGRTDAPASDCVLEQWRGECQQQGSRAREALRDGVEAAILALGQGFLAHPANRPLRQSLADGTLTREAYFNELLRCVYRMIFLLTIEERELLFRPDASDEAKRLYAEGYGMRRLRERAVRRSQHDRHGDLWSSLRPVFSGLGQPEGEAMLGLPGLGGLFAADQCPHLDRLALDNRALLGAVYRLAWIREREGGTLARVNWKDMGPEELGSVYESLLELVPLVSDDGRRFSFAGFGESAGNARKLSGSYYTPDSLVQQLLDTSLEPVLAQRVAEQGSPAEKEQAILDLTVVDPACGSGHFLLAAARRLAGHLARLRAGGTPGASEYRRALRDVVTHCIHGVDRNPMALELARMALWLEAYTPERALGFLDHHLQCGDALLGLLDLRQLREGVPDEAFKALTDDNKDVTKALARINRGGRKHLAEGKKQKQLSLNLGSTSLAQAFAQLEAFSDDGVQGVEAKRRQFMDLREKSRSSTVSLAADCYVAAYLMPKRLTSGTIGISDQHLGESFPTTATITMALEGTLSRDHTLATKVDSLCEEARVFHWPLAFPHVFAKGGFDVVVGNPPWEKFTISEEEWFAARAPEIASVPSKSKRAAMIADLEKNNPQLFSSWRSSLRQVEALTAVLTRKAGLYPLTGFGELNTYHLFAERAYGMLRTNGRCGMIVKTGICSAKNCLPLFEELTNTRKLVSLFDFVNTRRLFPAVQTVERFSLLTFQGASRDSSDIELATLCQTVEDLKEPERIYRLSPEDIQLMSPVNGACPLLKSELDASIMRKVYRAFPVLERGDREDAADDWNVRYVALFHMSNDSGSFRRKEELEHQGAKLLKGSLFRDGDRLYYPLYEGKYIYHFDHRFGTFEGVAESKRFGRKATAPSPSAAQLRDPAYEILPRYWIDEATWRDRRGQVHARHPFQLHFRDVAGVYPDLRTAIAALCPSTPAGDKAPVLLLEGELPELELARRYLAFTALFCSMPFDYVVRNKLFSKSLKWNTLGQIPMPAPSHIFADARSGGTLGDVLVHAALELTYCTHSLRRLGELMGVSAPFLHDPSRRWRLMRVIDATSAHLYGVERAELAHILSTFQTLERWEQKVAGSYASAAAVMEIYDSIARQIDDSGRVDLTSLASGGGAAIVYDAIEADEEYAPQ